MRILLLTQLAVYPADAGPKKKTFLVLQRLAQRHTIYYCTFVRSQRESKNLAPLHSLCHRVITIPLRRSTGNDVRFFIESIFIKDSFLLHRDDSVPMQAAVRHLLQEEQIDIVHVDQLNMMRFVPDDWAGTVLLDAHNAVWQVMARLHASTQNLFKRWLLARETGLIRHIEAQACARAHTILAVSEHDKQALNMLTGSPFPITVLPIAVDIASHTTIRRERNPQPNRLLTIGTLFWPPNSQGVVWWLREGYDFLSRRLPDLTYDIVGARPSRELQRQALRHKGVSVHRYIPDPTPFWTHTTALAVPLLTGGGVRVKILEAMAMGVPVISTSIGCEGLEVQHGTHLLIADTPKAFAAACAMVLKDTQLADNLARNAYHLMQQKYDTKVVMHLLDHVYASITK